MPIRTFKKKKKKRKEKKATLPHGTGKVSMVTWQHLIKSINHNIHMYNNVAKDTVIVWRVVVCLLFISARKNISNSSF
jgi:hypothetical protein